MSQTIEDIKFMNNNCLRTPSMDNTLPYWFYTNVKTTMDNKNVFWNTLGETCTFLACDVYIETCRYFTLSNLLSQTVGLHYEIKKKMLVELCEGNYETTDGLVNGANGFFEDFT